jgi:hypothetical protein
VYVPDGALYSYDSENDYHVFEAELLNEDGSVYNGELRCRITEDGEIVRMNNGLCAYEPVAEEELISEAEAAEKLKKGSFDGEYFEYLSPHYSEVRSVALSERIDSKGFLQPVYEFTVVTDRADSAITVLIPALR